MLAQKLRGLVFKTPTGLKPETKDERDFQVGWLWGVEYQPKHDQLRLPVRSVYSQAFNTCGWHAATGMKEIDEGETLDPRSLVMFGRENGLISGDGFSQLRDNQKMLQKHGVAPSGLLTAIWATWNEYSDPKYLTAKVRTEAAKRRIKSYLKVNSVSEVYKALDEGRPVEIGIDWYTGYNLSGGFKLPWIIHKAIGWLVGGHALYVYGYDRDYKTQKVFIIRNSFGDDYGDKGDLYLTEAVLAANISKYGAFINYDLDPDLITWLKAHQGNVVKGEDKPNVYLIQGDKKRFYPDLPTLYAHGKTDADIVTVDQSIIDTVAEGEAIDFWDGGNVSQMKLMAQKLKVKDMALLEELKKYFSEL